MATIQGTVSDEEGTGIEDATVTVFDSATDANEAETTTDANGDYSVSVEADTHDVRAERISYASDEQETVNVGTGETKTVNLTLSALQPKVIGRRSDVGIGVLGETTAGSGVPIGLKGVVDSADGYGLYTPDAVMIGGFVDTDGNDFTVEAGSSTKTDDAMNVVLGHASNAATDSAVGATVGGGGYDDGSTSLANLVQDDYGTVGGGLGNTASGGESTVGGGDSNTASGNKATVAGGDGNSASDAYATVGGGRENVAGHFYATVSGGRYNTADGERATVGGGTENTASSYRATIGGGAHNTATSGSTIAGGTSNVVTAVHGAVGGGTQNTVSEDRTTVGGGYKNTASEWSATVGGGWENTASGLYATVGGGYTNIASGSYATVGGGMYNKAHAKQTTISGGRSNRTGTSGSTESLYATVPGGRFNVAEGAYSFAAGRRAKANHDGSFVWGDSTVADVASTGADQFLIRASGGVGINEDSPTNPLHVSLDTNVGGPLAPGNYAALVDWTPDESTAEVLALRTGYTSTPGGSTDFIGFFDGNDTLLGEIQGDGSGGITLNSSGSDYAEHLPRLDSEEDIEPAEVVGVVDGAVTKRTAEAEQALVVSEQAIVTGNSPGPNAEAREDYEVCAFVGQVPVKVRGPVEPGDLVVPSGDHDGIARAVAPEEWTPGDGPLVGRAWEGTDDDGVTEVTVAVGLETGEAIEPAFVRQAERIDHLEATVDSLREHNDDLRSENETLHGRLDALESRVAAIADSGSTAAPADD